MFRKRISNAKKLQNALLETLEHLSEAEKDSLNWMERCSDAQKKLTACNEENFVLKEELSSLNNDIRNKESYINGLEKQLNDAERLLEEVSSKLSESKHFDKCDNDKFKTLMLEMKSKSDEELSQDLNFQVDQNKVAMNTCKIGGCAFNEVSFKTNRDALEYAYILTVFGEECGGGVCPNCVGEYNELYNS